MRWRLIVLALAFTGSAALAQTHTQCLVSGASVDCNTSAPPPPVQYPQPVDPNLMLRAIIAQREARAQAERAAEADREEVSRRTALEAEEQERQDQASQRQQALDAQAAAQQAEAQRLRDEEAKLALQQSIQADNDATFRRTLGEMIAAGHCDEARRAALEAGKLEDAATVGKVCTPSAHRRARRRP